ncbi:MAG: preprotein translocase subunit YajC [Propionibacteriaceae bacterium]|nr:preprotein translocase subunit YajC [Propionibacteriaceae bacterium]
MSSWSLLLWVGVFAVIIYFFMIRPGKKKSDEQRNMMNSLQPGTRVMLTSGIFGTIETMGEQQVVIELAPGTAITVVKQAIAKVLTEADEEFEYADEDAIETSKDKPALTDGTEQTGEDGQDDVIVESEAADPDTETAEAPASADDAAVDEAKK